MVKDQTARTAAETLRIGYFGLFGAPAYLVSDQGKAFTGHVRSAEAENLALPRSDQWSGGAHESDDHPHDREAGGR